MSVKVHRPDKRFPRGWQAICSTHLIGLNSSKPSCIIWADQHVKDEHPGEKVEVQA